ncbi:hypothetical protein F4680DRAFT_454033 [Xylaria scruposa]|nr:hypothetical protein F4680DRAFT_454033 [Xylaria scruposa]
MYFHANTLLLFAASTVRGSAVPKDGSNYMWDITQWQAGLSHGNPADPTTSWYAFTVSGSDYETPGSESYIPAFGARCTGSGAGSPLSSEYSECAMDAQVTEAGSAVSARIVPNADFSQAHIAISYVFSNAGGLSNWTATAVTDWARERPPYNFALNPSDAL